MRLIFRVIVDIVAQPLVNFNLFMHIQPGLFFGEIQFEKTAGIRGGRRAGGAKKFLTIAGGAPIILVSKSGKAHPI